ncbi:hypothetical protein M3667_15840 [Microbacterium sp. P26]|uniref:hypothetical protein n=1 Tax=Microbacterium TaxID=33882 RepID=UPI00203EE5AC|nr:hypothetical protein [Microbacterium sp. P26]MCM3503343.1 hypothetical protein [Microbacterium sp. P26]
MLTLSLDSASLSDGPTLEYSLSAVDAWTAALGSAPSTSPAEGPPGYDLQMTVVEWPGLKMTVPNDGSATGRLFVSSPTVAGHPVVTAEGLSVGSTRAEGVAAGAVDGFDSTELRLGFRDVPGTQSLQRPGETGREYVMLVLDGDSVKSILVPADDYSDL